MLTQRFNGHRIWRAVIFAAAVAAAAAAAEPPAAGEGGPVGEKTGPPTATKEEQPYHVEADVTEAYTVGGDRVLHGIGHVVIVHGDTTINCDEAYSYEAKKMSTLLGNVRVNDKVQKYTLTSGYAEYYEADKKAVATRGPVLVLHRDREITITGDLMQMWTAEEYGEAVGNVHLVSEDVEGDGQKLKYFGKEDRIELSGTPVVRQKDSRLAGDLITLYLEEDKVKRSVVDGSAHLVYFARPEKEKPAEGENAGEEETSSGTGEAGVSPEAAAEGGAPGVAATETPPAEGGVTEPVPAPAVIEPASEAGAGEGTRERAAAEKKKAAEGEAAEEENPTGRVEASGDRMVSVFVEGKLETVDITGNADGHYWPFDALGRETGEQTDARGDRIKVVIAAGEVKKILVDGNAEGVYRPAKAEGRSGVTRTTGDHITVFVFNRNVRRIVVAGHARGSYFSEETPGAEEGGGAASGEASAPGRRTSP
jgi:lipopolysaccharide export system protein LptA